MESTLETSRTGSQSWHWRWVLIKVSRFNTKYTHCQVPWGHRGGVCSWLENHLYQGLQVHFFIRTIKPIFPQLRWSGPRCVLLCGRTGGTFGERNPHSRRQGNSRDPWHLQKRGHRTDPSRGENPANNPVVVSLVRCIRGQLWWGADTPPASVSQTPEDSSLWRHPWRRLR